jgi:hypothetical protein
MTGKPVFAASEREKVLFPDPAIPVTRTRRPIAKAASLIDVSVPQVPIGLSSFSRAHMPSRHRSVGPESAFRATLGATERHARTTALRHDPAIRNGTSGLSPAASLFFVPAREVASSPYASGVNYGLTLPNAGLGANPQVLADLARDAENRGTFWEIFDRVRIPTDRRFRRACRPVSGPVADHVGGLVR